MPIGWYLDSGLSAPADQAEADAGINMNLWLSKVYENPFMSYPRKPAYRTGRRVSRAFERIGFRPPITTFEGKLKELPE